MSLHPNNNELGQRAIPIPLTGPIAKNRRSSDDGRVKEDARVRKKKGQFALLAEYCPVN
jgi:hypothetical protein